VDGAACGGHSAPPKAPSVAQPSKAARGKQSDAAPPGTHSKVGGSLAKNTAFLRDRGGNERATVRATRSQRPRLAYWERRCESRLYAMTAKQPRRASAETPAEPSISGTHRQKLANVGPEAITVIVAARANLIPVCMFFPPRSKLRSKAALKNNMFTKQRVKLVRRLVLTAEGLPK
jgi:hypothetical protein